MMKAEIHNCLQRRTAPQFLNNNNNQSDPVLVDYHVEANDDCEYDEQKGHSFHAEKRNGSYCSSLVGCALNPSMWSSMARQCFFVRIPVLCEKIIALAVSTTTRLKLSQTRTATVLDKDNEMFLAGPLLCALLVYVCFFFPYRSTLVHRRLRITAHHGLHPIDVLIPSLNFEDSDLDIGGWLFGRQFYQPTDNIDDDGQPDQGNFTFIGLFGKERDIFQSQYDVVVGEYRKLTPNYNHKISKKVEGQEKQCQQPYWIHLYHPSCNAVHEMDLSMSYDKDMAGLGDDQVIDSFYTRHRYFRDVWVVVQTYQGQKSILKTTEWRQDHDMDNFFSNLRDALIMERFTASPRIVDIYGHCGTAVWVEAIPFDLDEVVLPGEGLARRKNLNSKVELKLNNNFAVEAKLDMAIGMAESLAELYGVKDGVRVHQDVKLGQWLRTRDGMLKLGDFNQAEILEFNERTGQYCKYSGSGDGNYRSPEEYTPTNLDNKSDVLSIGTSMHTLLAGNWIFYENEGDDVVHVRVIRGESTNIDPDYRTRSFIEGKLVDVIEKCWVSEAEKRIDIFEALRLLKKVKEHYAKVRVEELEH